MKLKDSFPLAEKLVYFDNGRIDAVVHEYKDGGFASHMTYKLFSSPEGGGDAPVNARFTPHFNHPDIPKKKTRTHG